MKISLKMESRKTAAAENIGNRKVHPEDAQSIRIAFARHPAENPMAKCHENSTLTNRRGMRALPLTLNTDAETDPESSQIPTFWA